MLLRPNSFMVHYSKYFRFWFFFSNQFCSLTYIQVGFVLHVVVFNGHFLSFQENLRTGKHTQTERNDAHLEFGKY